MSPGAGVSRQTLSAVAALRGRRVTSTTTGPAWDTGQPAVLRKAWHAADSSHGPKVTDPPHGAKDAKAVDSVTNYARPSASPAPPFVAASPVSAGVACPDLTTVCPLTVIHVHVYTAAL